jgi:hypothetical protein
MKKAVLSLLLATMSTGAMAEWVQVYEGETSAAYADLTTIRKMGKTVKMWDLVDMKQPQVINGELFQSVKSQSEYDCANVRSRLLTVIGYSLPPKRKPPLMPCWQMHFPDDHQPNHYPFPS